MSSQDRFAMKMMAMFFMCLAFLVIGIILSVRLTEGPPGPPQWCHGSGVHKVDNNFDGASDALIVCNNGMSYIR